MPCAYAWRTPMNWRRQPSGIPSCISRCFLRHFWPITISVFDRTAPPDRHSLYRVVLPRIFALLAVLLLTGCPAGKPSFQSTDITGAEFGKSFTLTDHNGKLRDLSNFKGK